MKSLILFVAASLILVGATIAVSMPSPVQADPNFVWCPEYLGSCTYDNKGDCNKAVKGQAGDPKCVKRPIS